MDVDLDTLVKSFNEAVDFINQNGLSLTQEYTKAAVDLVVDHIQKALKKYFLASTVGTGITAYVGWRGTKAASEALRQRKLKGNTAIATTTHFRTLDEINPETNNNFVEQRIRPAVKDNDNEIGFDISLMFNKRIRKEMMRLLNAAKKHCTDEEPCVFSHIRKVEKPECYENTMTMMSRAFSTYFGQGNEDYYVECLSLPKGVTPLEETRIPLLVWEPNAHVQQWRVFVVDPQSFATNLCSDRRDLRVEVDRGRDPVTDLSHHSNLRHESLLGLAKNLEDDPELFGAFQYQIPIKGQYVCAPGFENNLTLIPGYTPPNSATSMCGSDYGVVELKVTFAPTLNVA